MPPRPSLGRRGGNCGASRWTSDDPTQPPKNTARTRKPRKESEPKAKAGLPDHQASKAGEIDIEDRSWSPEQRPYNPNPEARHTMNRVDRTTVLAVGTFTAEANESAGTDAPVFSIAHFLLASLRSPGEALAGTRWGARPYRLHARQRCSRKRIDGPWDP